jgi:hypothetical protein
LPAPTLLLPRRATALGTRRLTNARLLLALLAAEFFSLRLAPWPLLFDCRARTLRPFRPTGIRRLLVLFSTEFFSSRLTRSLLLRRCCSSLRPLRLAGAGARGLLALRLPARPLLLGCCRAALRPLRLTLAQRCRTLRRPWRVLAKAASFACRQGLRRWNSISRRYRASSFAHSGLAKELITPAFAQPLVADLNCARNARCSGEHQRPHVKRANGPAHECRDDVRRDAGIDRIAVVAELVRAIDDRRIAEKDIVLARRHHDRGYIRRDEVARLAENPIVGSAAIFDDDLLGGQRFPADISIAPAP